MAFDSSQGASDQEQRALQAWQLIREREQEQQRLQEQQQQQITAVDSAARLGRAPPPALELPEAKRHKHGAETVPAAAEQRLAGTGIRQGPAAALEVATPSSAVGFSGAAGAGLLQNVPAGQPAEPAAAADQDLPTPPEGPQGSAASPLEALQALLERCMSAGVLSPVAFGRFMLRCQRVGRASQGQVLGILRVVEQAGGLGDVAEVVRAELAPSDVGY